MKPFKKFFALVLALMLVLCLCACNTTNENVTGESTGSVPASSSVATKPSESTSVIPAGKVQFKVTVVDEDGNPIVGVYVQVCNDETCLMPVKTDEAGVATFAPADEGEYHANFLSGIPEGYEADAEVFDFAAGETELTIVLRAISG